MKTAIIIDDHFAQHVTPLGHPECPMRYWVVKESLLSLKELASFYPPRPASLNDLLRCHHPDYCKIVEEEIAKIPSNQQHVVSFLSTGDVCLSHESQRVALLAAGAVLTGVDAVMSGEVTNAFCVVRPPGHHATSKQGMGFCIYNNAAIGARYVQEKYPDQVKRVLIVDWDVHHGNGTQEIFYHDPSVFYFSTHEEGIYPWTGRSEEVGTGLAIGTTLNIPIKPDNESRQKVFDAFNTSLKLAMELFRPNFIIISAGFDAHHQDPLGGLDLIDEDFAALTRVMRDIGRQYCGDRIVSVLEGGYNLQALATAVPAHVKALME